MFRVGDLTGSAKNRDEPDPGSRLLRETESATRTTSTHLHFKALNNDFRYQLTVIGTFAQAIVAPEIKDNRFTIKTSAPSIKVSWMVTGIRRDAFANKYRIPTEEAKPERERGFYLHPKAFNQPAEKSVEWARYPETMSKLPKP